MNQCPFAVLFDGDGDRSHRAAAGLQTVAGVDVHVNAPQTKRAVIAMPRAQGNSADWFFTMPADEVFTFVPSLVTVLFFIRRNVFVVVIYIAQGKPRINYDEAVRKNAIHFAAEVCFENKIGRAFCDAAEGMSFDRLSAWPT